MSEQFNQPTVHADVAAHILETLPTDKPSTVEWEAKHLEEKVDDGKIDPDTAQVLSTGQGEVRSAWEELSYVSSLRLFWKGVLVCFLAAFSSATDGYQISLVGNLSSYRSTPV
jgi:hypothetical protein